MCIRDRAVAGSGFGPAPLLAGGLRASAGAAGAASGSPSSGPPAPHSCTLPPEPSALQDWRDAAKLPAGDAGASGEAGLPPPGIPEPGAGESGELSPIATSPKRLAK
eukprot:4147475-Alexandrium_andersonii.AAC.1